MIDNDRGRGHDLCLQIFKKYDLLLLSIEAQVLDRCWALDRLANVDAHFWYQPARLHRQRLRSPEIDSEESIPPAYVAWRAGTTNKVVVRVRQIGNRFLGSLKGL